MKFTRWPLIAGLTLLLGCQDALRPRSYILGSPAGAAPGGGPRDIRPVLGLRTVSIPDYLDSSDMILRDGAHRLTVSPAGRWGERLSIGIADALRDELRRRLPGFRVSRESSPGSPFREIVVDIAALEMSPDGRCVLTAQWTVGGDGAPVSGGGEIVVGAGVSTAALTGDTIAAAMEAAIGQLARRIAITAAQTR